MAKIFSPYELWPPPGNGPWDLKIERWEVGESEPFSYDRGRKTVVKRILRIYVPRGLKPYGAPYWDIGSKTLIATLLPYLEAPGFEKLTFRIRKVGVPPAARYGVEIRRGA